MEGSLGLEIIGAQKRKMIYRLDEIIFDEDNTAKIEKENKKVSEYLQTRKFGNNEGEDIMYMNRFQKMKMALQCKANIEISKLTTYEFYALIAVQKAA